MSDYQQLQTIYALLGQALGDAQEMLDHDQQRLDAMPGHLKEVNLQGLVKHLTEAVDNMTLAYGELTAALMKHPDHVHINIEPRP